MHDWHDGSSDDVLLRASRAAAGPGSAWWARTTCPRRGTTSRAARCSLSSWSYRSRPSARAACASRRRRCSPAFRWPQHRHRELRLLLLSGHGAASVSARRQRRAIARLAGAWHGCARASARAGAASARLPSSRWCGSTRAPRRAGAAVDQGSARLGAGGVHPRVAAAGAVRVHRDRREAGGVREGAARSTTPSASSTPITCLPGHHARAHRTRIPDQRRRRPGATWTACTTCATSRATRRARPTSSSAPPAARVDFQLLGSTASGSSAASQPTSPCWSSGSATTRPKGAARCSGAPLPQEAPHDAVRIAYWRYHHSRPARSAARDRRVVAHA